MASTIKWVPGTDIIELRYAGEIAHAERLRVMHDLEARWRLAPFSRLLVNYTSAWPAQEPADAALDFLQKLVELEFPRGARIAFLNPPDEHAPASEPVAAGVGYSLRRFQERPDAIAWLQER